MLSEPIPHRTILNAGYKYMLVLSTKPLGFPGTLSKFGERLLTRSVRRRYGSDLHQLAVGRRERSVRTAAELKVRTINPMHEPCILTIAPAGEKEPIDFLDRNQSAVKAAANLGSEAIRQLFND